MNQIKIKSLKKIYNSIPNFECKHCHQCCNSIIWFEPEELLIRNYLKKKKIQRVFCTIEEFKQNPKKCPYLIDDRCIIYPIRPIVCRLQGNVKDLKCELTKNSNLITDKDLKKIKKEFIKLIIETNGSNIYYSTRTIKNLVL